MRIVHARHLVVGGGLLGLATADHLLRRGAEGVMVIEARRALGNLSPDRPGVVLSTGRAADRELESRNRVLLEEWPSYLEVDPSFRRSGAYQIPSTQPVPEDWEELDPTEFGRRLNREPASSGIAASFIPRDGVLDVSRVVSALHDQIRKRGGRVITEARVHSIRRHQGSLQFDAGNRGGRADQVYFTAGAGNLALARESGIDLPLRGAVRQQFDLAGGPADFRIVRTRGGTTADSTEAESGLELDFEAEDPSTTSDDPGPTEILVELRDGTRFLSCWQPGIPPGEEEPPVDFSVWSGYSAIHSPAIPGLDQCSVRTASAHRALALSPTVSPLDVEEGIWVAGGFGPHGLALAFAVAEQLAEVSLSKL